MFGIYSNVFAGMLVLACWPHVFPGSPSTEPCNLRSTAPRKEPNITRLAKDQNSAIFEKYLFKSSTGMTWCQAYQECRKMDLSLASYTDKHGQENSRFTQEETVDFAWVAGRRKHFGANWTWVNQKLQDLDFNRNSTVIDIQTTPGAAPYGQYFVKPGSASNIVNERQNLQHVLCDNENRDAGSRLSWYEAGNKCVEKGGRLATLEDIASQSDIKPHTYWIGLYYRPWLWFEGGAPEPIFYSSWQSDDVTTMSDPRECLALQGGVGNLWTPKQCDDKMYYFICQGPPDSDRSLLLYILIGAAGLVLIMLFVISCMTCRRASSKAQTVPPPHPTLEAAAAMRMTSQSCYTADTNMQAEARAPRQLKQNPLMMEMTTKMKSIKEEEENMLYYATIRDSRMYP